MLRPSFNRHVHAFDSIQFVTRHSIDADLVELMNDASQQLAVVE
jgi:hypothetical protein